MNCLVCGHKLAIFRKISLGDFCCQEHRTLFLREQNEQGVIRLAESAVSSSENSRPGGTRGICAVPARGAGGMPQRG